MQTYFSRRKNNFAGNIVKRRRRMRYIYIYTLRKSTTMLPTKFILLCQQDTPVVRSMSGVYESVRFCSGLVIRRSRDTENGACTQLRATPPNRYCAYTTLWFWVGARSRVAVRMHALVLTHNAEWCFRSI